MLKKIALLVGLFFCLFSLTAQNNLTRLADKTADETIRLLKAPHPVAATVAFQNYSYLSDVEAQTFYQLFSTRMEQRPGLEYRDLLVQFNQGKGRFNLSEQTSLRYGLYVTLRDTPQGLACGVAVRLIDDAKLLGLVHEVAVIDPAERWLFSQTVEQGAPSGALLRRRETFRVDGDIFAVAQNTLKREKLMLCALTSEALVVWSAAMPNQAAGKKMPLKWAFPRSPSLQNEGRITFFQKNGQTFMTLGSNFSPKGIVLQVQDDILSTVGVIPFVAVKTVSLGEDAFLAGGRYIPGTNRFDGELRFLNLNAWNPVGEESAKVATRQIKPFYDLAIGLGEQQMMNASFLACDPHRLEMVSGEWTPLLDESSSIQTGANLIIVDNRWLMTTGIEEGGDSLSIYDVTDGGFRLLGQEKVDGQIQALSEGFIEGRIGVWVLRYVSDSTGGRLSWLDFWEVNRDET